MRCGATRVAKLMADDARFFPAEIVDFSVTHEEAIVARASAVLYANFSCADGGPSGYPEQPFETCVDAGWGALTVFSVRLVAL